jgi:hypothetical protein
MGSLSSSDVKLAIAVDTTALDAAVAKIEAASGATITLTTAVESEEIDEATEGIDELVNSVSSSSPVVEIKAKTTADTTGADKAKKAVADVKEEAEGRYGISIKADAKNVAKAAADAAKEVQPFAKGFFFPIAISASSVKEIRSAIGEIRGAFGSASSSIGKFNGGMGSAVITAASVTRSLIAANNAFSDTVESSGKLSTSMRVLSRAGSSITALTTAISTGGAAFVGGAAGATANAAATRAVESATKKLNPQLRDSVRFLSSLGIAYAETVIAARVSAAAASVFAASIKSGVNPLAAASAFCRTYTQGLDGLRIATVAAEDRQRVFVRGAALVEQIGTRLRSSASGAVEPFVTGYTRARAAGDGYFTAVARGARGQINSVGILRRSIAAVSDAFAPLTTGFTRARSSGSSFFAALDRGFTAQLQSSGAFRSAVESLGSVFRATGVSAFFDPLVTGFTRARAAGAGYFAATARGVSGQLNSSAAYRAAARALGDLGTSISKVAGSFIGINASTREGRLAYDLFSASVRAVQSNVLAASGYFRVLGSSISAGLQALPGGSAIVKVLSDGFSAATKTSLGLASNMQLVGGALRLATGLMTVAAVAGGKFRDELAHMAQDASLTRNLADRFGATTQEIEKLKFAADSAGVGLNQLGRGQQQLFSSLSKIRTGQINTENVREAKLAFDKLGIGIEDLRSKKPQEIFQEIAEKITKIKDPADRTAIAFDLFGKQGAAILPALKSLSQVEEDLERLDVQTSTLDFSRIEGMASSFNRVRMATKAYAEASLTAYTELQAGFNNFRADVVGGLASLVQNSGSLYADFTKPIAVVLEVFGRIINIILRAAAVVVRLTAAFAPFPTIARFAQAVGEGIKTFLLKPLEDCVTAADKVATALYEALTPDYWSGGAEGAKSLTSQIIETSKSMGIMILTAGAAQAAMTAMGLQPGAAMMRLLGSIRITQAGLLGFAKSAISAALGGLKALTIGLYQTSVNFVAAGIKIAATSIALGVQTVAGWITPSLAGMIAYATGMNATAIAARIAAIGMAASWAIATLGLSLIVTGIVAVYQNFDKLSAFFADFSNNASKLFTFEGAAEAAKAVAGAIWDAFKSILSGIGGFIGMIIQKIQGKFQEIKPPEALDATKASAEEIVSKRKEIAQVTFEQQKAVQVQFGAIQGPAPEPPKLDNERELTSSIQSSRSEMDALFISASRFGDGAGAAAEESASRFRKLQQELADGKINADEFNESAKKIADDLRGNLKIFSQDNPAVTDKKNLEFYKSLNNSAKEAAKSVREIGRGTVDVDGKIFPASEEVKRRAKEYQDQYQLAVANIQARQQRGDFQKELDDRKKKNEDDFKAGRITDAQFVAVELELDSTTAVDQAAIAGEDAKKALDRNWDQIGRDISFAEDIRKRLDDAFLSPLDKYQKELKKIRNNPELTPLEQVTAERMLKDDERKSIFGETAGEQLRSKRGMLDKERNASGEDRLLTNNRLAVEQRKLSADTREAAGLEVSPAASLQLGVDKINDAFGVTGMSAAQMEKHLRETGFTMADYQDAIKRGSDAVKESVGVEKSGAEKMADSRKRLDKALSDGVISQAERDKAMKKQRDDFLSSLGVTKTPAEQFADALRDINEAFSRGELSLEEFKKATESAGKSLRQQLGISDSPMEAFRKRMKEIADAEKQGMPAAEVEKAKAKARQELFSGLNLDVASGFGDKLQERLDNFFESYGGRGKFQADSMASEQYAESLKFDQANNTGAFKRRKGESLADYRERTTEALREGGRLASRPGDFMRQLMRDVPGATPESATEKFAADMDKLMAVRSSIGEELFAENKLNLQAQLQEDLKPALDSTKADRRGIESSDVRSKAGVDTFFRILRGNDNPSLKAQLEIARNTRVLAEASKNPDAAPVLAQLSVR